MISDETQSKLLEFVFQFIDFILDVVRHSCVSVFENLIELHLFKCGHCSNTMESECPWIKDIFFSLSNLKLVTSFRLKALVCYHFGRFFLEFDINF